MKWLAIWILTLAVAVVLTATAHAQPSPVAYNGRSYTSTGVTFQDLGNPQKVPQAPGTWTWCKDCQVATTCVSGGAGQMALRGPIGWNCNLTSGNGGSPPVIIPQQPTLPTPPACNLYVDPVTGSGGACTIAAPCTLNQATSMLAPGKVMCLNDGTYPWTGGSATIQVPVVGTQSQPIWIRPTNLVQVIGTDGAIHVPTVKIASAAGCTAGSVGVYGVSLQYVNIYGLELDGSACAINGSGAYFGTTGNAHIGYYNNYSHGWHAGGLDCNNGDYCTIQGNVSFGNAATNGTCSSNISIYEPTASDANAGDHMIISGNISHDALQPSSCSDGEGIIVDDLDHTQSDNIPYTQNVRIENNSVYGNAGEGIEVFQSSHGQYLIRNNTLYHNAVASKSQPQGQRGEIVIQNSHGATMANNIVWPSPTGNSGLDVGLASYNSSGGVVWVGNICNTDAGAQNCWWSTVTEPAGNPIALNFFNVNPRFVDVSSSTFRLVAGSPAIGTGNSIYGQPTIDNLGFVRSSYDIGAYVGNTGSPGTPGGGGSSTVATDASLKGSGTASAPLGILAIAHDASLAGNGSQSSALALASIAHDATLQGTGAQGNNLGMVLPVPKSSGGNGCSDAGGILFANLPTLTSPTTDGIRCFVKDASSCSPGTAIAGGGTTKCDVIAVGAGWLPAGNSSAPSANAMTTLGDTVYGGSGGAPTRLPGNTSTVKQFYTQTGTGSVSAAPGLTSITPTDLTAALTNPPDIGVSTPPTNLKGANVAATTTFKLPPAIAVASLPAAPGAGAWVYLVNDWNATAGICAGGGSATSLAAWNGTNWICMGGSGGGTVSGFNPSIAAIAACSAHACAGGGTYTCYQPVSGTSFNKVRCHLEACINTGSTPDVCTFTTPFTKPAAFLSNTTIPVTANLSGGVPVSQNMPTLTSTAGITGETDLEAQ